MIFLIACNRYVNLTYTFIFFLQNFLKLFGRFFLANFESDYWFLQDISWLAFWKWSLVILGDLQESFCANFHLYLDDISFFMAFAIIKKIIYEFEIFGRVGIFSHHINRWVMELIPEFIGHSNPIQSNRVESIANRINVCKPIIFLLLNSYIKINYRKWQETTTNYLWYYVDMALIHVFFHVEFAVLEISISR